MQKLCGTLSRQHAASYALACTCVIPVKVILLSSGLPHTADMSSERGVKNKKENASRANGMQMPTSITQEYGVVGCRSRF